VAKPMPSMRMTTTTGCAARRQLQVELRVWNHRRRSSVANFYTRSTYLTLPADADPRRRGLTVLEVVVGVAIAGLLAAIAIPWVLQARAAARVTSCRDHLRTLALGLRCYHDAQGQLPPAAVWSTGTMTSLALHKSTRVDLITHANWAQLILPFAGEERLAQRFDASRPIGDPANAAARISRPALIICPDDSFNCDNNPHRFLTSGIPEPGIEFARGNYAINGGTHNMQLMEPSTAHPRGDFAHLVMRDEPRQYELWGNGIAGINRSFSLTEFANGQSTLVALEEVRAGIHPIDPRGVWALGQIGGSITWGHGVNGDAFSPNYQWLRSDDVMGCRTLQETVGVQRLIDERMPCVDYVDVNQQVTARSLHPGGVHVAFLDGGVRFISDAIDPGVWHVMHSRETPADVLAGEFDQLLDTRTARGEAHPPQSPVELDRTVNGTDQIPQLPVSNSVGMDFVLIAAGEFTMGLPDTGAGSDPPDGWPAHRVRITRPFLLGTHEITHGEYSRVMRQSDVDGTRQGPVVEQPPAGPDERLPIAGVTWNDAAEFCRRLSDLPDERSAGRWYRLPTEAEWEYACRNGKSEPYRWQEQRRPDDRSGEAAGILPALAIKPVGSYPPNRFGLFDMRGNVWEWTADWFDREFYTSLPVDDPRGPERGQIKVVRGGDSRFIGEVCRIDYAMLPPWKGNPTVGFRVVCEVSGTRAAPVKP
jgi:prepilin-type processing-associated H-X9-DG protein